MGYADFQASDKYTTPDAGAFTGIEIANETDTADNIRGHTTGLNVNQSFEALEVEEAGNDGVDEIVQGRHTVNFSFSMILSPQLQDWLPTRQDFIGRKYSVLEYIAKPDDDDYVGTVTKAVTGAVIESIQITSGARGLKTANVSGKASRLYSGAEWADLTGGM